MSDEIMVIGGTRGTGKLVLEKLISQNRPSVLLARNVEKSKTLFGDKIRILRGDVLQPESLRSAMDSPIGTIIYTVDITGGVGGRGIFSSKKKIREVVYGGVVNTVDAAKSKGFAGQFILLSTLGLHVSSFSMTILNLIKPGVSQASIDKTEYLKNSGINYTVVQAGALHDEQSSGTPLILTQKEIPMTMKRRISRNNLAQILIAAIGDKHLYNKVFSIYGGQEANLDLKVIKTQLML